MKGRILVIAPHPDDETLGCGGTLLRHRDGGSELFWLIMSTISEKAGYTKKRVQERLKEIEAVAKVYNFSDVHQADFVTTELDLVPKKMLVEEVSKFINRVIPDTIYVPYGHDVHTDHQLVFQATTACTKSFRYPCVKKVRAYETLSETEFSLNMGEVGFRPNLWVNISDYFDMKIQIMNLYKGEIAAHPFPRSEDNIRALATFRGAVAGVEMAEAFMSLKELL